MNRRRFLELSGAAGLLAALAGCGSSEPDERRFANQPTPPATREGGTEPTKAPVNAIATSTSTISRESLLSVRGDVRRIALADGERFWSIRSDGADAIRFGSIPKKAIVDVTATPDGSKIGTMISSADGDVVAIRDENGAEMRRVSIPAAKGTPAAIGQAFGGGRRIAWNAVGDQLLYAKLGGGIDALGLAGDPKVLVSAKQAAHPGAVVWSPAGDAIAFATHESSDASDGLYAGSTSSLPVDAAMLVKPSTEPRSITEIAWLRDGMRILFVQRSRNVSDALSGDLFEVTASGGAARLFISAGLAAPVSAIGTFAASPGGEAIAFTVWAPNGAAVAFHSLWVKPLDGGSGARIDVASDAAVTELWWTDTGLVWREQTGTLDPTKTDGPFRLQRLTLDGKGALIFSSASAVSATPAASPAVASPAASPVASPAKP